MVPSLGNAYRVRRRKKPSEGGGTRETAWRVRRDGIDVASSMVRLRVSAPRSLHVGAQTRSRVTAPVVAPS